MIKASWVASSEPAKCLGDDHTHATFSSSPDYVMTVKIGEADGTVTNVTKQGGIVSIYYLGAIIGCFGGGWVADRIGRINETFYASLFALVGGALQSATQSAAMILVFRVITGLGTGALTAIIPVYVSETSTSHGRGKFLGLVFIANYLGIAVAYWLDFGLGFVRGPDGLQGTSSVRWRFLLAFQCLPAIFLALGIRMLPDSPRYYISSGQPDKALEVLRHVRGKKVSPELLDREFREMVSVSSNTRPATPFEFAKVLVGKASSEAPNLARRAWLCLWLQIMASYTAITAVTAYAVSPSLALGDFTLTQFLAHPSQGRWISNNQAERTCWWSLNSRYNRYYHLSLGRRPIWTAPLSHGGGSRARRCQRHRRRPIRGLSQESSECCIYCPRSGNYALPVQPHLCQHLGHGRIPNTHGNLSLRNARSRKRIWSHWLGNRSRNDNAGQPKHICLA